MHTKAKNMYEAVIFFERQLWIGGKKSIFRRRNIDECGTCEPKRWKRQKVVKERRTTTTTTTTATTTKKESEREQTRVSAYRAIRLFIRFVRSFVRSLVSLFVRVVRSSARTSIHFERSADRFVDRPLVSKCKCRRQCYLSLGATSRG